MSPLEMAVLSANFSKPLNKSLIDFLQYGGTYALVHALRFEMRGASVRPGSSRARTSSLATDAVRGSGAVQWGRLFLCISYDRVFYATRSARRVSIIVTLHLVAPSVSEKEAETIPEGDTNVPDG
jgi:hypothetical protein